MLLSAASGCIVKLADGPSHALDASQPMAADAGSPDADAGTDNLPSVRAPTMPAMMMQTVSALPDGEWINATANLAGMTSECGDLSGVFIQPSSERIIAGVATRGLFSSSDRGESWQPLGEGPHSDAIMNRSALLVYDPEAASTWWEAGSYDGPGVFRTDDDGQSFHALGAIQHIESLAIDFTDPERKLLVAGGHEAARTVYRSADGGNTWTNIGADLPDKIACQNVDVRDADTYLIGCDYGGEAIFRTTDAGHSWTMVSSAGGSRRPLHASDGSIYWARPGTAGMVRSTDDGETWTVISDAALQAVTPIELPDGRIASLTHTAVVASDDHGATWAPISSRLPYDDATGFIYSPDQKAFFIKHFQCIFTGTDTVLPDAIMRFDFE